MVAARPTPATSGDGSTGTTPATGGSRLDHRQPPATPGGEPAGTDADSRPPGGPADESGWRVLATSDAAGHVSLALVPDTDTVPTALDVGTTGAEPPRVMGWFDGDGDYGFVADDLVFTTPAGQVTIDHLTLQGNVAERPGRGHRGARLVGPGL